MKVGDLVIMPPGNLGMYRTGYDPGSMAVGVVVKMPQEELSGGMKKRVGVLWSDGSSHVDWEPADWLEVISENR